MSIIFCGVRQSKALGKLGNIVADTLFPANVSQSGQTLGNISEKHRETSNVSEFARKHFCFSGSKFCFRNNVSTGGQTGKHLTKHRESQMFPQQCFLVCPGLKRIKYQCIRESIATQRVNNGIMQFLLLVLFFPRRF